MPPPGSSCPVPGGSPPRPTPGTAVFEKKKNNLDFNIVTTQKTKQNKTP